MKSFSLISDHCYKMMESNRSESEEGDGMDELQLSSDSIDTMLPKKRLRVEDSEDEAQLPANKRQSFSSERSKMIKNDNSETASDKNNIDGCDVKEQRYTLCPENEQMVEKVSLLESNVDRENEEKRENGNKICLNESNVAVNDSSGKMDVEKEIDENEVII